MGEARDTPARLWLPGLVAQTTLRLRGARPKTRALSSLSQSIWHLHVYEPSTAIARRIAQTRFRKHVCLIVCLATELPRNTPLDSEGMAAPGETPRLSHLTPVPPGILDDNWVIRIQ